MLQVFIRQETIWYLGINCRVWVAVDCNVTCVGGEHEPLCGCHSWFQSALKAMWVTIACQIFCQPGEHTVPLSKHILEKKKWWQLGARDTATEDTARATLLKICCWRCILERRHSMQKAGHLWRICGLWATQARAGEQTRAVVAGGWPVLGKGHRETEWQENLKKS